jgi:hypothetical protein
MKKTFFPAILLLSTLSIAGLSISIDLEEIEILPGTEAMFTICFTNTGDTPMRTIFPINTPNWNYFIELKTTHPFPEMPRVAGSRPVLDKKDICELKPRESVESFVAPNIFVEPGEYSYRVVFDPKIPQAHTRICKRPLL